MGDKYVYIKFKNCRNNRSFYSKVYPYLILSTACELKLLKDILDIDEITFNDCLEFDENIKLDLFDNYDF